MRIGILGTGGVGRSLAGRFAELGHDVVVGTRDPETTMARREPDAMGGPPYAEWAAAHPAVRLGSQAEAAAHGEVVVNATAGSGSVAALRAVAEHLVGTVVLDVANPLDFSHGMPPTLFVKDDDSLAEQIQRAVPRARVVKSLSTMNALLMADPQRVGDGDTTVFVSGDDADAKATVVALLTELGWRDIIDLGDLSTARGTEMWLSLWVRLMAALGTVDFNLKVVR